MAGQMCNGYSKRSGAIAKESKAFCEGQLARQQDMLITDNPHAGGNAMNSWNAGWFVIDQQAPTADPAVGGCCAALGAVAGTPTDIIARWDDSIPSVEVAQGGTWDIDLNDYIAFGSVPMTFAVDTGGLPAGITLDEANGTFTGTVTNVAGTGQATFLAINGAGTSEQSPSMKWTIPL